MPDDLDPIRLKIEKATPIHNRQFEGGVKYAVSLTPNERGLLLQHLYEAGQQRQAAAV